MKKPQNYAPSALAEGDRWHVCHLVSKETGRWKDYARVITKIEGDRVDFTVSTTKRKSWVTRRSFASWAKRNEAQLVGKKVTP